MREQRQSKQPSGKGQVDEELIDSAVRLYKRIFDEKHGGFGDAPKFPTPHNLLFLMKYYEKTKDEEAMKMVEKTLLQMYRGGMFDHIGWGFSRYSTDRYFLAPHFEKMLYDNALLILAYCKAYQLSQNMIYLNIAEKTATYVLREMTSKEGGFYSAQDADSEGVEGKYYLFEPTEISHVLGEEAGKEFNQYFDITENGNFEGKSIPNLLHTENIDDRFLEYLPSVYEYRKKRYSLHLDDKILTSWNALMIAAMCNLYRVSNQEIYLEAAKRSQQFIFDKLLVALSDYLDVPDKITIVLKGQENLSDLPVRIALGTAVRILEAPTEEYSLKNDMTTFYVCQGWSCQPPTNHL